MLTWQTRYLDNIHPIPMYNQDKLIKEPKKSLNCKNRVNDIEMKAQSIDQVICHLDAIIQEAKESSSPLGYFPALYRKVTIEVQKGINEGHFDDGERMEKLDIIFANRYLSAFTQYKNGQKPTQSWQLAFEAAEHWRPTVLQHLFLGMTAHIDLDLGIAAAQTVQGQELTSIRRDFNKINQILNSLLNEVQLDLAEVWPLLKFFDLAAGDLDETFSRFGIEIARSRAWNVAQDIASQPPSKIEDRIHELDQETYQLGKMILAPGKMLQAILLIIRVGEIGSIPKTITILED